MGDSRRSVVRRQYQFEVRSILCGTVSLSGGYLEIILTANPKPILIGSMKTKFILAGCLALLSFTIVRTAAAADANIEQALRDADAQWSKAAGAKDLDKA